MSKEPVVCPLGEDCRVWQEWVTDSLKQGERQFEAHQNAIAENTAITEQIAVSVNANAEPIRELVEILKGAKTGISVVNRIGKLLIWLGRQATWLVPLGGLIYFLKTGHLPPKGD